MAVGNRWYRAKLEALRKERGDKCADCGDTGTTLEFHHTKPTGLNGRGRGQNHRVLDILRNPGSYVLLCRWCHERAHYG